MRPSSYVGGSSPGPSHLDFLVVAFIHAATPAPRACIQVVGNRSGAEVLDGRRHVLGNGVIC